MKNIKLVTEKNRIVNQKSSSIVRKFKLSYQEKIV